MKILNWNNISREITPIKWLFSNFTKLHNKKLIFKNCSITFFNRPYQCIVNIFSPASTWEKKINSIWSNIPTQEITSRVKDRAEDILYAYSSSKNLLFLVLEKSLVRSHYKLYTRYKRVYLYTYYVIRNYVHRAAYILDRCPVFFWNFTEER